MYNAWGAIYEEIYLSFFLKRPTILAADGLSRHTKRTSGRRQHRRLFISLSPSTMYGPNTRSVTRETLIYDQHRLEFFNQFDPKKGFPIVINGCTYHFSTSTFEESIKLKMLIDSGIVNNNHGLGLTEKDTIKGVSNQ